MAADELLYRVDDGVATITLNRPDSLNTISLTLQQALRDRLAQVRDDRAVRALVITGAGRAFCAGADLGGMGSDGSGRSTGAWMRDAMHETSNPMVEELRSLPVPTIAAVNGPAAGGGVGIALAADVVIAARSAYFMLPFVTRLGLVPDLGASWMLPRLVGRARSLGLALFGERLAAADAAQWGLIWACVDDDALRTTVMQAAQRLAALPPQAVVETRRAFDAATTRDLAAQLQFEADCQGRLGDAPDFAEGVSAFLDKRAPVFHGR